MYYVCAGLIFVIKAIAYPCGALLVQVCNNLKHICNVCAGLVFASKAITYMSGAS